jgi:two-component system, OmpR family, phosphate regulon sensor histidine kinase PhoR
MSSSAWNYALVRMAGILAGGVLLGWLTGYLALTLIAVLAGYLAVHFVRLYRLERWLRHRRTEEPPDFAGVWGDVVALVMRIYRRKQFHKQRIVQIFREFRLMTSAVPDGVIVLGPDREILWFNRAAGRLLSLRRKVDYGQRIENLIRQPDFTRYIERGDHSAPVVVRAQFDSEVHLSLHLIAYGDGQKLLTVRDVTQANRLEAMRKDFVANASHELRSPLTVIAGYVDALSEDPSLDPAWRPPLAEMARQADRMRAVVDDLIELSRLEATGGDAGEDVVDVGGMLALIRRDVMGRRERPREINLTLDSDARLLGSEPEIHSIFTNLISNAAKYTPADGRVDIRWWVDADGGHFRVRDTGVGIPREHIPRITERFYRVDPGRSRATGGSGLGLAIVKHALQRHNATLQIESEHGQGSTFTCHFPARRVLLAPPAVAVR